tara:strand:+ start:323 stop:481 length:159 start_codon:yes stop_codon:yes gene_type:complete
MLPSNVFTSFSVKNMKIFSLMTPTLSQHFKKLASNVFSPEAINFQEIRGFAI